MFKKKTKPNRCFVHSVQFSMYFLWPLGKSDYFIKATNVFIFKMLL